MKHGRGRNLTIVSDCHSSGSWVNQCQMFLCGPSAKDKKFHLRIYASCEPDQNAVGLHYTIHAMSFKDGDIRYSTGKKLAQQNTMGADFTEETITCENDE